MGFVNDCRPTNVPLLVLDADLPWELSIFGILSANDSLLQFLGCNICFRIFAKCIVGVGSSFNNCFMGPLEVF